MGFFSSIFNPTARESRWELDEAWLPTPSTRAREPRLRGLRENAPYRLMAMRLRRRLRWAVGLRGLFAIAACCAIGAYRFGTPILLAASIVYPILVLFTIQAPVLAAHARPKALLPDEFIPDLILSGVQPGEYARALWGLALRPDLMRQRRLAAWMLLPFPATLLWGAGPGADGVVVALPLLFYISASLALACFDPWHVLGFCAATVRARRARLETEDTKRPALALAMFSLRGIADGAWNGFIFLVLAYGPALVCGSLAHAALGYPDEDPEILNLVVGAVAVFSGAILGAARGRYLKLHADVCLEALAGDMEALLRLRLERIILDRPVSSGAAPPPRPAAPRAIEAANSGA